MSKIWMVGISNIAKNTTKNADFSDALLAVQLGFLHLPQVFLFRGN